MSGLQRIYRPNRLAYPGIAPGFDPAHVAMSGGGPCRLSAFASGTNFFNILNGAKGTTAGTNLTSGIDIIGPQVTFPASSATLTFPKTATDANLTLAVIINNIVFFGHDTIIEDSPSGWDLRATNTTFQVRNGAGSEVNSGIPLVSPCFYAVSFSAAAINFLVVNLVTGQVQTATAAGTTPVPNGPGSGIFIGTFDNGGGQFLGKISHVMCVANFLSLSQLLQWAADPFSFWYPRTVSDLIFSSLNAPAAAGPAQVLHPQIWM